MSSCARAKRSKEEAGALKIRAKKITGNSGDLQIFLNIALYRTLLIIVEEAGAEPAVPSTPLSSPLLILGASPRTKRTATFVARVVL